jgi:hypothetical protein
MYMQEKRYRAHKIEDPFGVSLPAPGCLVIFLLSNLQIHGEERPRAIAKIRFSEGWLACS